MVIVVTIVFLIVGGVLVRIVGQLKVVAGIPARSGFCAELGPGFYSAWLSALESGLFSVCPELFSGVFSGWPELKSGVCS